MWKNAMPVIIDGHNLIGKMSGISLADPHDEEKLIDSLARHLHFRNQKVTVVFDKAAAGDIGPRYYIGRILVIFAPPESSADAIIIDMIKEDPNPKGLTVISSDNEIRRCARSRRARVMTAEEFARKLESPDSRRRPYSKNEDKDEFDVEDWLQYFKRRRK